MSSGELALVDAYWRAANYLSVGQIYLLDNPLLREPLVREHVKPRLLGHFGTTPGLNLVYAHLNRAIRARDLSAIYVAGPGHGGPGLVANAYLEGTYSEVYPHIGRDVAGLTELFRQFSFPGGIPSHVAPETPGSIHEGGELGYALSHAFGAAFDNPDLLVCCVVGDGEAETGPLATGWHGTKFLSARHDGAVLPVLHLNGYKIANPAVLARIPEEELGSLLEGYGWRPLFVSGDVPVDVHRNLSASLDEALDEIAGFQRAARHGGAVGRPRWPMIVLRTPKGWTGPKEVDGLPVEGTWRSHQVPLANVRNDPEHLRMLEEWLESYRPGELFDESGALVADLATLPPRGDRRMSANPHTNGGVLLRDLRLPDFQDYAVEVTQPGTSTSEATRVLGAFLRDVVRSNPDNFRIFGPDETDSNRLGAVFEATARSWDAETLPTDDHLSPDGRVMEVLSEHQCQGWLEGYLLTGRHGLFNCYEAFIHIVDSMFNQHAKWLKTTRQIPWRRPVASLNYLLSSHVWRQDHNGFSHQDPGFIDHVANKKAEIIRVYLPPDANCLLSVADHCLRSRHYVNVIVAGKQPALDYLSIDDAIVHCTRGLGIWEWASNDGDTEPDVVLACCGDVPTLETLAATALLRERLPELKVRVVNIVDLMRLQPENEHPHGLSDAAFDALFTTAKPVIFAYHGYPWLIHRLTYRRTNHANLHVRGYKEEGTTTTPFDMVMLNDLDRFHLVLDVIDRVPGLGDSAGRLRQEMVDARLHARLYTRQHGEDDPAIERLDLARLTERLLQMQTVAIHTDGLTKRYGSTIALESLDLTVEPGEVYGYLGPNGAGKTTTIRLLLGLHRATAGRAELFGDDAWNDAVAAHRRVAYVAGEPTLWPGLTGAETLVYLGNLHGGTDPAYRDELIERFRLDSAKKVRALSKGNRQKIQLVAALATRADLLILDEPTSGLDPLMEQVFREVVGEAKARGQTIFLSSHILSEVEALCDRIGILRQGRLVDEGTLDELRHLSVQTLEVTFAGPRPDIRPLPGIKSEVVDENTLRFEVSGSLPELLADLAKHPVAALTSRLPSLEEIFLHHYDAADDARG